MHKIVVTVDRNGYGFRGIVDNKELGKVLFSASSFDEMKEVVTSCLADFITFKVEEGKVLPQWMKRANIPLHSSWVRLI